MNDNMRNSYSHIINLEFSFAMQLISLERKNNPDNRIITLQENYIDFLKIIIGEDEKIFVNAKNKKSDRINFLKEGDKNSPYYLYSQAELHLQWAFARIKFEEYLTAAYELQKAYYLFEKNQQFFPEFKLNKKGLGLLHTLVGAIPQKYKWIVSLTSMEGSVSAGLKELKSLLIDQEMRLYRDELLFMISFLQLNLTNDELAYKYLLNEIGQGYLESYLLNFTASRLAYALGENELTINILEKKPSSDGKYPVYYLDYLQGMSLLYKLDFNKAEYYFNRFLRKFKGKNYVKSAYHKLGLIAFLRNDHNLKIKFFKKVNSEGISIIDEDKVALKEAKADFFTNQSLLSARFLYDGGYYDKALVQLNSFSEVSYSGFYDEYWYRLSRIHYKLGYDSDHIIENFKKSFDIGRGSSNYFAAMSALQIAFIYENRNDYVNAKLYFDQCLSLTDFDYQRGIHQKAKLGLARILN